jgi:hypothetical protein
MKKKKVIAFLIKYKFTDTDYANFNFLNLCKIFNVKFLDIHRVIIKKELRIILSKIKEKKLFYNKISNTSDLKKELLGVDLVFDFHQAIIENKEINNFFNKKNFKTLKVLTRVGGVIPNFFNHSNVNKLYFLLIFILNIPRYKFFFIIKSVKKLFIIYFQLLNKKYKSHNFSYDYVLVDSDLSEKIADRYFANSKKIHSHYKDYERHLLKSNNGQYQNNYAVFLDEAVFNHPDNYEIQSDNQLNLKRNINIYFKDLNNFFNNFEKFTNCKIIIAAHPRGFSNFDYVNYFRGRRIVRNNSYELIKKSKLVFAHSSTSIAYAVILKKPIIFLNSNLMFDIGYFTKILSFSIETGGKLIDINRNNINYNNLFNQDFLLYKNYLNKFVKSSKSKNKKLWNSIASVVNN